ncbi:WhiB family transcriptional regulator [Arcanobacterium hippocoleae]
MTLIYQDQTWAARAACAAVDPDALFVRGSAQRQARQVCVSCPVRIECLADALDSKMTFGIWGGLTERERRAILRRYPNEDRWYERLTTSDEAFAVALRAGGVPRIPNR